MEVRFTHEVIKSLGLGATTVSKKSRFRVTLSGASMAEDVYERLKYVAAQKPLDADPDGDRDLSVMGSGPSGNPGGRMLSAPPVLPGPSSTGAATCSGGVSSKTRSPARPPVSYGLTSTYLIRSVRTLTLA
ncbi:unnamed protein product [Merluccius merluccius]